MSDRESQSRVVSVNAVYLFWYAVPQSVLHRIRCECENCTNQRNASDWTLSSVYWIFAEQAGSILDLTSSVARRSTSLIISLLPNATRGSRSRRFNSSEEARPFGLTLSHRLQPDIRSFPSTSCRKQVYPGAESSIVLYGLGFCLLVLWGTHFDET